MTSFSHLPVCRETMKQVFNRYIGTDCVIMILFCLSHCMRLYEKTEGAGACLKLFGKKNKQKKQYTSNKASFDLLICDVSLM